MGKMTVALPKAVYQYVHDSLKQEPRYKWRKEVRKNPALEMTDNFTTPAGQAVAFRRGVAKRPMDWEVNWATTWRDHPNALSEAALKELGASPDAIAWLSSAEKRFRISAGMVLSPLPEQRASLARQYLPELSSHLESAMQTLVEQGRLTQTSLEAIKQRLATAPQDSLLPEMEEKPTRLFESAFITAMEGKLTLKETLAAGSAFIHKAIDETPVGLSFRPAELINNIRWGDTHFYGGHGRYTSTSRDAYLKKADPLGGYVEATLNLSVEQKKKLAIQIDRGHQSFDRLFGDNVCHQVLHGCGTYPVMQLTRAGAPYVSPVYSTPEGQFLSLGVQKALGMKNVKDFTFKPSPQMKVVMPLTLFHSTLFNLPEITAVSLTIVIYKAWRDSQKGEEDDEVIAVDEEGHVIPVKIPRKVLKNL